MKEQEQEQDDERARFESETEGMTFEEFENYVDRYFWNPMPTEREEDREMQLPSPLLALQNLMRH